MTTLTEAQARSFERLERFEGKQKLLREVLLRDKVDEDDNAQQSIYLDYLYDNLQFTLEKGFSWKDVSLIFSFVAALFEDCMGKNLTAAINVYRQKVNDCLVGKIRLRNIKIVGEFVFSTFFTHFKLYQWVFANEQKQIRFHVELPIEIVPEVFSMKDAREQAVWEYEQSLQEIEERERLRRETRELEHSAIAARDTENIERSRQEEEMLLSQEEVLERETLLKLIQDVASARLNSTSHGISFNIVSTVEDLDFKIQKKSLLRPKVLSILPPYETKPPIIVPELNVFSVKDKSGPPSPRSGFPTEKKQRGKKEKEKEKANSRKNSPNEKRKKSPKA